MSICVLVAPQGRPRAPYRHLDRGVRPSQPLDEEKVFKDFSGAVPGFYLDKAVKGLSGYSHTT